MGFPDGSVVKKPPAGAGATAPFLGREDALEEQIHYSCLEHPMDRGAWRATVQAVAKSQTQPQRLSTHTHMDLFSSATAPQYTMRGNLKARKIDQVFKRRRHPFTA